MNYKLTPLMMFIFILILFLISIYFVYNNTKIEGFISYNQSTPTLNQLYIAQYSKSNLVYKLFDSIYFDSINGNIIELFGKTFSNTINTKTTDIIDTIGSTLTDIIVISRPVVSHSKMTIRYYDNSTSTVLVDDSIIEKKITNSFIYDIIPNESTLYSNSNILYNYQILYISWGKDTLIHVYDCFPMNNVNIGTFLFRNGYDPIHYMYRGNITTPLNSYRLDNIDTNNSFQPEILYDEKKQKSLFQLTSHVLFDTTCRHLIIRKNNTISVYDGTLDNDGINAKSIYSNIGEIGKIINTPDVINMNNFSEFRVLYISDIEGANLILYIAIPSTKKTVIAILSMNPSLSGYLMIKNIKTFNQDNIIGLGLDGFEVKNMENKITSNEKPTQPSLQGSTYLNNTINTLPIVKKDSSIPSLDSVISNYYKTYWNENQSLIPDTTNVIQKNDYLLTNEFKSSNNNDNTVSNTNINDLITTTSDIKRNENIDSSGNKTIEYNGNLFKNYSIDNFLKSITGITLSENKFPVSTPTSSLSMTPPPTIPSPTPTIPSPTLTIPSTPPTLTTPTLTSLPPPPSLSTSPPTVTSLSIPVSKSTINPSSTSTSTSTTVTSNTTPVQILNPTEPYKKIDYGSDASYKSSIQPPGPTFGNRIVPDGNVDYYSYYGSIPEKESSNFTSLSSDFSKFGV